MRESVGSADKEGISRLRNERFRGKVRGEAGCRKSPRQGAACHRESSGKLQARLQGSTWPSHPRFRIPLCFPLFSGQTFFLRSMASDNVGISKTFSTPRISLSWESL